MVCGCFLSSVLFHVRLAMQDTLGFQSSDRALISQPPSRCGVPLGRQTLRLPALASIMSPAPEK